MDIITISKLFSIFKSDGSYELDKYMSDYEIDSLKRYHIIREDKKKDNFFYLSKRALYRFAKNTRKYDGYDIAIIIFEYLLSFNSNTSSEWFLMCNYQLFKTYFYKGNIGRAYECFKTGYHRESPLYPIMVDLFDYLLNKKSEETIKDSSINHLVAEHRFEELDKKMVKERDLNSHKEILSELIKKSLLIKDEIMKTISDYLLDNKIDELIIYINKLEKEYHSNKTISFIKKIINANKLIINETIEENDIIYMSRLVDLFTSNNLELIIDSNDLDNQYKYIITYMLKDLQTNIINSKYKFYIKGEASKEVVNISNKKNKEIVLDNLCNQDSIYLFNIAKKKHLYIYDFEDNNNRRVVLSSDSIPNYDKFIGLKSETSNKIEADFKFFGINNVDEVLRMYREFNIPIEIAAISNGLDNTKLELLKLFIARNYYAIGDIEQGDLFFNAVENNNHIINLLSSEIEDNNKYVNLNYEQSKDFIKKLQKK